VFSEAGSGTTFRFILPINRGATTRRANKTEPGRSLRRAPFDIAIPVT
jgi:hypothetical protein